MSFANSGFNPLAASGLSQLLGMAQAIVPESFGAPSAGYGMPAGYGSGYAVLPGGGYGVPAGYGAGYAALPGGYGVPVGGYGSGYASMPGTYTVTQTTYQQTYYGAYPADPYGMASTMTLPPQAGWGGGYYPAGYY